ncbi:MAG: DUF2249 domain-containing protein [Gammaproteobacteria bacterium]|jgi:uncharacterized protein (DUF2249 family)|nr:DUF2249 domain-containing protein [Gammaproteobacteria bacterium]HEX5637925.1 DUF2249 domain-containing protein [Gammaproteobacteria bacterium]
MPTEIILDVHDMQPPAPMEVAMDALQKLKDGEYIKMIHRMQPFPLYNILYDNGFQYKVITGTTSAFDIYIWKANDKASAQAIKNIISG